MRMRSSNPALKRVMQPGQAGYGQAHQMPYGQPGYAQPGHGQGYQQPYAGSSQPGHPGGASPGGGRMTIDDVVMRTGMTLGMVVLTAAANFFLFDPQNPGLGMLLTIGGALGGLVLGLVIAFKQSTNPALILTYAALEGLFVGGISRFFELAAGATTGALVTQAVLGTLIAFGATLGLYRTGVIRVTNTFVKVVSAALVAALVLVLVNLVASFFIDGGLGLRSAGPLGVVFTLGMIVLACAVLAMDFKGIEDGLAMGVPNQMAWHFAFGLTVTLVWLYIEILRLLWMLYAIFGGE